MCLVVIAAARSERFPFVLASNRDEFFERAASPLAWWPATPGAPEVLAGRDLSAGGTWLGLNRAGDLALVTNVREPGRVLAGAPSRGMLVSRWLQGDACEREAVLEEMAGVPRNGFNFLAWNLQRGDGQWLGNRPHLQQRQLGAGLHGLSNAMLDTPWPKVLRLRQRLADALAGAPPTAATEATAALFDAAFAALADGVPASDDELPRTGVPVQRERQLSSAFIRIGDGSAA
jgi:uncharacterized protein with NRDE domain